MAVGMAAEAGARWENRRRKSGRNTRKSTEKLNGAINCYGKTLLRRQKQAGETSAEGITNTRPTRPRRQQRITHP